MPKETAPTRSPYRIEGPAIVNVSGGRTSGFMLRQILDAHGGTLPADVVPVFCNTGREHEATLRFLHEIETRWTPIVWLEYRYNAPGTDRFVHGYEVVDYCRASRNGEPFAQLLENKRMLPNPVTRFCTTELKIRTAERYARRSLGWVDFTRVVGLRADEPRRVASVLAAEDDAVCPMHAAGHTLSDVRAFWRTQPFDLDLPGDDPAFGNCDLCFLKGRDKLEKVMRTLPNAAAWWIAQEESGIRYDRGSGRFWRKDRPTYRQMLVQLTSQGRLLDDAIEDDTLPCMCHD